MIKWFKAIRDKKDKLQQYYNAGCFIVQDFEQKAEKHKMQMDSLNALVSKQEGIINEMRERIQHLQKCVKMANGEQREETQEGRNREIPKGNVFGGNPKSND